MKFQPLQDRVIVRRQEEIKQTASGIIIPDMVREKPDQGEVIAVGNGKPLENGSVRKLEVKPGDKVVFGKFSGQAIKVGGEELLVMREDDLMGILLD